MGREILVLGGHTNGAEDHVTTFPKRKKRIDDSKQVKAMYANFHLILNHAFEAIQGV